MHISHKVIDSIASARLILVHFVWDPVGLLFTLERGFRYFILSPTVEYPKHGG